MDKDYFKQVIKNTLNTNQWSYTKRPSGITFSGLIPLNFRLKRLQSINSEKPIFKSITGFHGEYYFATARMGLYWFLKQRGIGNCHKVILQAFNCAVVPDAVLKTGAEPVFVDIERNSFNPSFEKLKEAMMDPMVKAVVLQNSFGFSQKFPLSDLRKLRPDILFVLDSALSFTINSKIWTEYLEFDCVMLSFDLSKPIAIISGGAILVPNINSSDRKSYDNVAELRKSAERVLLNKLRTLCAFGKRDGIANMFLYLFS
ncbi:DegT/DnrJ/EryC1/StrS family aminotransferase, partial [Gammaproteobacteria bacterium]|nr:DegT/DnrJ/EryC1/StrS family aminotransferase [Gammaproteobacteria bacterium]